jgi:hypothetical protein
MRKPGTQTHNERGGATGGNGTGGGAKKATHDDEQDQRGRFTKNTQPAGQSEKERDQPAERNVPSDPSP